MVDGVTGATITSTGVITALNMAINASIGRNSNKHEVYTDTSCDIVVVGAGGTGLCAAVRATEMGAKTIVLEKQGIIGGNTNYSTGGINASETKQQRQNGIEDSNKLFYDDTMKGGHNLNIPSLVESMVNHSAETVDWLSSLGCDLSDIGLMGGSSVKRTHRPAGGSAIGSHLMKVLKTVATEKNISLRTHNKVTGLIAENGTVKGVIVEDSEGKTYKIHAKAVIIATGGFGANIEMVTKYKPELKGFPTLNHAGATGDAFEWVKSLDGGLLQMDQIQIHPTAEAVNHILITEAVRGNGAIMVNIDGKRFVNEMGTRDVVSSAILSQPTSEAFLVFDNSIRKSLSSIETYFSQNLVKEGGTIEELAQVAGINASNLSTTISRYGEMQAVGEDEEFGRMQSSMPYPLSTAPFYAIRIAPAIHHTMGGISVDKNLHVLKTDGTVIPGLFAAGEVTGGFHGGNRLSGNAVCDITVNGKLAGENAYRYTCDNK